MICRDYLGSITHIANADGSLKAEYSYDAWGRLRNPATHAVYDPGSEPALFLGRGFTGHEHLPWFGLINMNARLYDAALGRFLSPDPYVQAPDFSQSFNRYSYGWNNPLVYTDPDGEWIISAALIVVGAYLGGVAGNEGELNPVQWDWQSSSTYGGIALGGFLGYVGGYYLINPETVSLALGVGGPAGGAYLVGSGSEWSFQWSTVGGGFGDIDLNKPVSFENIFTGSNRTQNLYVGGYADTSPEYDPSMAYQLGGVWLPEITVSWDGNHGSGNVKGGIPYWWGRTNSMANPLTQARMMNQGIEVMIGTLAVPVFTIGLVEMGASAYGAFHLYKDGWHWGALGYHTLGKTVAKSHGLQKGRYLHLNIFNRHLPLTWKNLFYSLRYFWYKK